MGSFQQDLFIDMFVDMFIFEKNQTPFLPWFTFIPKIGNHSKKYPCFRYEGKTGKERNLVIFTDTLMNNLINGEFSTRPFHWYGCW